MQHYPHVTTAQAKFEGWEYCQDTRKVHAQVLQNLRVRQSTAYLCHQLLHEVRQFCMQALISWRQDARTMRFGSTAKVLLKCKLKYYRISECARMPAAYT